MTGKEIVATLSEYRMCRRRRDLEQRFRIDRERARFRPHELQRISPSDPHLDVRLGLEVLVDAAEKLEVVVTR
ncbi:MAG TPA: hypothetical protein VEH54_00010 [Steroidobacteraceae bacterium]|nr:hypothetical protein [Steroidobacteraceae bacterium]